MSQLIWIIDDEWPDYEIEKEVFKQSLAGYEIRYSTPQTFRRDLEAFGRRADAILCQISVPIDRDVIDRLENCRILSNYGTGYNNIDVQAAREKGIPVGYIPGYCAEDIADYVAAVLCAVGKPLLGYDAAVAAGQWGAQVMRAPAHRLCTATLFVVGLGRIGTAVAKRARALGVTVLAWGRSLTESRAAACGAQMVSLEEGLARADFVSLHIQYCAQTERFFDAACFQKMKPQAWLINTARGGVVDQAALLEAVRAGRIGGAFLDVLAQEPPEPEDPVLHCANIHVTPHISYYSEEALRQLQRRAAENAARVLCGQGGADIVPV